MKMKDKIGRCTKCQSENLVKNGHSSNGKQQYYCKDCGVHRILESEKKYNEERKDEIIRAKSERVSLRGIERIFHVARQTVTEWMKKKSQELPSIEATLQPFNITDVLEFDEVYSYVGNKKNKRWIWLVLSRLKKQIIAYFIGDRSAKSLKKLYSKIPKRYKKLYSYSDEWKAYTEVLDSKIHTSAPKQSGETSHIERFNNTLRQRLGRLVRKTLSFSKSEYMHDLEINAFIIDYNLSLIN
jgi:insertion element IS1 protein InsB